MDFVAFIVDCVSCRCRLRAAFEMRWLATQVSAESESKPAAKSIWCSIAECTALALLEHLLERFAVAKIEPPAVEHAETDFCLLLIDSFARFFHDLLLMGIAGTCFVFATGTSNTHVNALADELEVGLKSVGIMPDHMEGYRANSWVLMDYNSVIVHIFTPESREFYDLDRLWQDGESIDMSFLN